MAIWKVPVKFGTPDFKMQIELDGVIFGFRFTYNDRVDRWSMEIEDQLGNTLVAGVRMVSNWGVLDRFKDPALPKGRLFTCDMTEDNTEPTEITFGDTVLLCYEEAATA